MTLRVHFSRQGQGKPLVFFHGWGFDSSIWKSLVPRFSQHYQLYLVDLPGFGLTPNMNWDQFKQSLALALPADFAVIGWSMGGLFATRLAIEMPTRVSHLINIASNPCFIQQDQWPGIHPSVLARFYQDIAQQPKRTLANFTLMQGVSGISIDSLPSLQSLQEGLDILLQWDLRDQLHQLTQPVRYLFGQLDTITPQKVMGKMQERFPQFSYTLFPHSAHMPFLSHVDHFYQTLEEFIR